MKKGFHTSAFIEHDLGTACAMLKHMGFNVVTLRLSLARLDPFAESSHFRSQIELLRTVLDSAGGRGLEIVVDADAPYLLDPWSRDMGSLLEIGEVGRRRVEVIKEAVKIAVELRSTLVTFSAGVSPAEIDVQVAMDCLADRILEIGEVAESSGVTLAIRPRVGSFVDSIGRFERLIQWIGGSPLVRLAADVNVMVTGGEMPVVDGLQRVAGMLACVYLSDIWLATERSAGGQRDVWPDGEGGMAEIGEGAWIGSGHISAVRIIRGLQELQFAGPVILDPVESTSWTPASVQMLCEQVFDRVIFTK